MNSEADLKKSIADLAHKKQIPELRTNRERIRQKKALRKYLFEQKFVDRLATN